MGLKYINEDGSKIQEYDITLKTEVLLELIAGVSADLGRYMKKQKIDKEDKFNSLAVMYWDLEKMRRQLYKAETMEDVMFIQHKSIYIKELINEIGA